MNMFSNMGWEIVVCTEVVDSFVPHNIVLSP